MKVTIITPCYNAEKTIASTLESVSNAMRFCDSNIVFEHIVVDGASNDRTLEIVKNFPNVKIFSKKDKGVYYAMNQGIEMSTGEIIGILNADDFYAYPEVLNDVIQCFAKYNVDSVYGDLQYVSNDSEQKVIRNWKSGFFKRNKFLFGWMPPHPSFFVKKECYLKYGFFNTVFKTSADYELMLRFLYKNKISAHYLSKVLVKMRVGGMSNSSFKNRFLANREDYMAWKINELQFPFLPSLLKPLSKIHQFL